MICVNCDYRLKDDIDFLLEAENINMLEFSKGTRVSRTTLDEIMKKNNARGDVCEKIYSFAYHQNYRINSVKEELLKEKYPLVLFHGSKDGLTEISENGSRNNCDFGNGFYLGETYNQALSFVCEKNNSSVYSFHCSLDELKIKKFECDLEWMLALCYYRGTINNYKKSKIINKIVLEVESADVIIAPIADNKMFYVMAQFTEGEINADVALHSLSASKLGLQYVFKTKNSIQKLIPIEKYYICEKEREDCRNVLIARGFEIDTKLKLAKREFKNGLFIEEILNEEI